MLAGEGYAEPVIDMARIRAIESGGDRMAYNKVSGARGQYQLTPICIEDFNRLNKAHYRPVDAHDAQIGARIAYWYMNERIPALLRHYGYADTVEHRLVAYNAGVGALKRKQWPSETRAYIKKYHKGGV
jgi:hypothetical protein